MGNQSQPNQEWDELRQSEGFRKIFDYSNDAIFVIDPRTDEILDANFRVCDMLGYTRDGLLASSVSAMHPDANTRFLAFTDDVYQLGSGWTDELTCLTKSGETLPAEISASVIEIDGRRCVLAMVRNIAERKRAESALQESEQRSEQELHRQLKLAAKVHCRLIPQQLRHERIDVEVRYIPIDQVGGDYYQVRFADRDTCYITMCDVTWHGIGASALAARVSSEVRHFIMDGLRPSDIV